MTTLADFDAYDRANPAVWQLFERFALDAARRGRIVGAKAIWERMRWECSVECKGDEDYKLNNNYTAWYVRKFREAHPGYGMIFATRTSQADKEPTPMTFPTSGGQGYINW